MPYSSLSSFVELLEQKNELIRINQLVSPFLEIAEITDRLSKSDGKAILFENTGTGFPLLINSMGSEKRICLALGVKHLDDLGKEIMDLAGNMMQPRDSFLSKLAILPALAGVAAWMPRRISGRGKCQQVIMESPDLSAFPVLTCWPFDGGPFITLPIVHTVHPETGQRNVGMYRMQVMGKDITGMHWHLHKNSASHFREYKRLGLRMPVSVALGGDPAYTYSATAPLPENVDEYLLAGFIRKKRVEMVKCITSDLEVPADADIIIEGYVDPDEELVIEGPFGDHTGFYSLADYYPRFHVTCITHRKDAIFPATIVGIPPQEDAWIGKATERIFLAPIRFSMLPEIEDMVMPVEGVFHNIVLVKIRKTFPGQALKVMNSLWGAGQMMFNKVLIVLDRNVDLNDYHQVARVIAETVNPLTDLTLTKGPVDVLDHSSSRFAIGSKLGIDATDKLPSEKDLSIQKVTQPYKSFEVRNDTFRLDDSFTALGLPLLMVFLDKQRKGQPREIHSRLAKSGAFAGIDWVVYMDKTADGLNPGDFAWLVANNIDPVRDCFFSTREDHVAFGPLAIDGTMKSREFDEFEREWPNVITMSDEVISEIDRRWEQLGLGQFVPSPSLRYKQLVTNPGAVASH
jgi:4-hydroxy-3-polyprenylbenzoate decarboxylase